MRLVWSLIPLVFLGIVGISEIFADDAADWKSLQIVGKYINSEPQIPDQTFLVPYKITNGTLISIDGGQSSIVAIVNTTDNGLLEVKFPRSFPYTNEEWEGEMLFFITINGYGPDVYYLPETTPMMEHVRDKIINKIDRPPPHPYGFSEATDCHYIFEIPFYTFAKIEIIYGLNGLIQKPYHGDNLPDYCIDETIVDTKKDTFHYAESSLKQEPLRTRLEQIVWEIYSFLFSKCCK